MGFQHAILNTLVRKYLAGFLIFICLDSSAQIFDWSNPQRITGRNNYTHIIGQNSNGIYIMRSRKHDFRYDVVLEKYRNSLGTSWTRTIEIDKLTEQLENIFISREFIYIIKSYNNAYYGVTEVYFQKMDFDGNVLGDFIKIASARNMQFLDLDEKFTLKMSDDNETFFCFHLQTSIKDVPQMVYNVFNKNGEKLWEKLYTLPRSYNVFYADNVLLHGKKDMYTLYTTNDVDLKKRDDDILKHYLLLYNADEGNFVNSLMCSG